VGLVAFAGDTVSYPLTIDYSASKLFWRDMMPQDMPVGGTAIGKAIVAANRLLAGVRGKGTPRAQVILLLTDGEDHESNPREAAEQSAKQGIRIYAVGIGSRSGEPIPLTNEDGTVAGYMPKPGGGFVTTQLDEKTLKEIASITKGQYLPMDPRSFGVEPIAKEIGKLKKSESQSRLIRHYDEVYLWFLLPGFLLLLLQQLLPERRRLAEETVGRPSAVASSTAREPMKPLNGRS
jgi:Ca-activated chloride channel family protein